MRLLGIHRSLLESVQDLGLKLAFYITHLALSYRALYELTNLAFHEVGRLLHCLQPLASAYVKPCAFYIR